jgi:hypothetical protein
VVAELRDSQAYVMLVGLGRSLFDYHSQQVRDHQEDWAPLLKWRRNASLACPCAMHQFPLPVPHTGRGCPQGG